MFTTLINAVILFGMAAFLLVFMCCVGHFIFFGFDDFEEAAIMAVAIVVSVIVMYIGACYLGWTDPSPESVPRTLHEIVTGSSTHAEDY